MIDFYDDIQSAIDVLKDTNTEYEVRYDAATGKKLCFVEVFHPDYKILHIFPNHMIISEDNMFGYTLTTYKDFVNLSYALFYLIYRHHPKRMYDR